MSETTLETIGVSYLRENFASALDDYERLLADLRGCEEELFRGERRIGLLAALIALEGGNVELPSDLEPTFSERLTREINKRAVR